MDAYQRELLVERIEREGATVGHTIPETITLGDTEFDLQDFVFETKRQSDIGAADREKVDEVRRTLRRARNNRLERIEDEETLSMDEGRQLADEIIGIDRALNALSDLSETDIEAEMKRREAADKKRWLSFVDDALDSDIDISNINI